MKTLKIIFLIILTGMQFYCTSISDQQGDLVGDKRFDLYFNDPGTTQYNGIDPIADDRIVALLDSARKTIHFANYGFKRQNIIDALIRAVNRGLDIQFAGDFSHYQYREKGYIDYAKAIIGRPNARLSVGNYQSIMHNKFAIVDRRYIMTGTGNLTDTGFLQNNNSWSIMESKELAQDFINEINQMMRGLFGHAKTFQDNNNVFNINGIKTEVYFSPYEDPMSRFLSAMDQARHSIHFLIFAFTHDGVARKLMEKHLQPGVKVTGVMDRSQFTHAQYVEVYRLAGACGHLVTPTNPTCVLPMDIKRDGNEHTTVPGDWQGGGGRLHMKTMIIDAGTPEAIVLTGSFNWSDNANQNNDENLLVIHSQKIAARYIEEFNNIYNNGIRLPGDQSGYHSVIISEVNWAGSMRDINGLAYPYDGNEFIELYNPTSRDIDISFWSLVFPVINGYNDTFSSSGPPGGAIRKRAVIGFPEGTKIKAGGYFVIAEPDLRNDNQTAYTNVSFNLYNELSNFMSLMDRRSNSSSKFKNCKPAYSDFINGFPSSNEYNVEKDAGAGLLVELHDNRGNLIDLAGNAKVDTSGACTSGCTGSILKKGGFHLVSKLLPGALPDSTSADTTRMFQNINANGKVPNYKCAIPSTGDSASYIMTSMERKRQADGSFLDGSDWNNWDDATKAGVNILPNFRSNTYATPGEKNSKW